MMDTDQFRTLGTITLSEDMDDLHVFILTMLPPFGNFTQSTKFPARDSLQKHILLKLIYCICNIEQLCLVLSA